MSAFADTSFLASFYISDSYSREAAARMANLPPPLLLSSLGELELVNLLQVRLFRKESRDSSANAARAAFRADSDSGILSIRPISDEILAEARRLSTRWTAKLGVRSLDIVQVASAIVLNADSFHTFDNRQQKLAKAAGLTAP